MPRGNPCMCLIALSWRTHPRFELALVANRDEFHARPSSAAMAAHDDPDEVVLGEAGEGVHGELRGG